MPTRSQSGFDYSIRIESTPARVLAAFFERAALETWWGVANAMATPRPLGVYALAWPVSAVADDLLGPLGGVYHGTVIDFQPGRGFFVADSYWLPPQGDPVGPMALEVTCAPAERAAGRSATALATTLRVVQRGLDDSPRWTRYYDAIGASWPQAFETLKGYLEHGRGAWDLRAY